MTQLIPSTNFAVRSLKGQAKHILVRQGVATVSFHGYGIWDKAAKAWVSLNDCEHGIPVPTCYTRSTARAAISQGLYNGYNLVTL